MDSYSDMLQGSNFSTQETLYEILSVGEHSTFDEIRAAYKSAALNTHPDKAQMAPNPLVSSSEQNEFLSVQKAWEILRYPKSRAEYDRQLQSSRQNLLVVASEIEIDDMTVETTADAVELLYPCRCGDYFSITSHELGKIGISVREDGEMELQTSDSVPASVVLGCGSCSLKARLVINKTS
ncbi:DPH4 homolog [Oryza brachyantha]|uniref:J domain-containing protein n=1 Tax=Oryza brachyantha TaxID=4533 RepID=J3MY66_ORYBR|nr:DPH4 homolog [Oryza brachyantha]